MVTSPTSRPSVGPVAGSTMAAMLALVCLTGPAMAAEVTASLDRQSVQVGEAAMLTIEVRDGDSSPPKPPQVPDLVIQGGRRTQEMSFYNGQMSTSTSFGYGVGSMKPGEYTIPPFTLTVDGKEVKTTPLKLKVLPSANRAPQGLPPAGSGASAPSAPDAASDGSHGFLTVELAAKDREHAWVGEIAAVRIKAWLPADVQVLSLNSSLQPEGSAFTLHNLSEKPHQGSEVRNGRQYRVFTWYGGLSAAKAGTWAPDLKLKATVAIRDRSARRQRPRSPFGRDPFDMFNDPFFDDVLAPVIQKEVVLTSSNDGESGIEVRALPSKGRPAGFSGAVGTFAFERAEIPDKWTVGEPQQVTAVVTGEGNFNLLSQPELQPNENWKSYSGQSEFTPKDVASFAGSQTFRFNAVPRGGGTQRTQLGFSYFDPSTGQYAIAESPAKDVEVAGPALKPATTTATDAAAAPSPSAAPDGLAPLHDDNAPVRSLVPAAFGRLLSVVLGGSGAAVLAGMLLARLRAVRSDPARIAREAAERSTREALREAESFADRGDVRQFFAAARRALQVRMAALWGARAHAITLADLATRVPADSPVVEFFREADRLAYSPSDAPAGGDLAAWRARLQEAMNSLGRPNPT